MRVLHVEVGGTYGGSVKALQLYLDHSNKTVLEHDVLFYYPTGRLEAFSRSGLKARVLVPSPRAPSARAVPATAARPGAIRRLTRAVTASARARELIDFVRVLPLVPRLRDLMAAGGYDVVHVNNTFTYQPASVVAAAMARRPVVAHVRAPVFHPGPIARAIGRRCAAMVTVNRFLADELSTAGFKCRISNVWDSVEAPATPAQSEIEKAREFAEGRGKILVGSVGRLQHNKGFETFIRAARIVADREKTARFVISGEGPMHAQLEGLLAQAGLTEKFRLAGFYPDAYALMCAMDVFVCSSLWEGGPLALLEAMGLGTAVVSTAMGLAPEIIADGRNGFLVPPANAEAMADAICSTIACGAEGRRRIAAAARHTVLPFTDLKARAAELDAVFAGAIDL
jgi:glycosyltransferase involved in cell wall biosynthesis